MSFVQRELDKIAVALREPCSSDVYDRLYTAQNALAWALEPSVIKSPYGAIMGTAEDSEGCPSLSHPARF